MIFRDGLLREHELHEILTRRRPRSMADIIFEAEGSIKAEEAGYRKHKAKAALLNTDLGDTRQQERFVPTKRPWDSMQNPRPNWNDNFVDKRLRISQIEEERQNKKFKPYTIRDEVPL